MLPPTAAGSPGDLDGSFSDDGGVCTLEVRSPGNNYLPRVAEDVAIQPDGRIVAVGELIDGASNWYFGAFRYLPNGELDPSFGNGGWVDTAIGSFEFPHAVAVQPDGGIVVAGEGDCQYAMCFVLARYRPDGSLDPGFGEGGIVRSPFGLVQASRAFDVSLAPDGKIVAVGFVQKGGDGQDSSHFAVARYLPDGHLDPSFSRDGRATVDFGYGNDIAYAVAHQTRGRIVVAGQGTRNRYRTEDDFAFARFRQNGRLDRGFSGDGRRTVNFGGGDSTSLTGWASGTLDRRDRKHGRRPREGAVRCTGAPHLEWGTGSRVRPPARAPRAGRRHRPGGPGRAGRPDPRRRTRLLRLLPGRVRLGAPPLHATQGRLDRSFGGDGMVVTDFGTGGPVRALAAHNGRILAAGSIYSSQGLARDPPR